MPKWQLRRQRVVLTASERVERRRLRFKRLKLGRALFVLPNLFTVASIFCGLYSIFHVTATDAPGPAQFHRAALAIFFAVFFDAFDGRVARLTKTQSEFGVQLDSLADVISFGVAPAVLVYRWGLYQLGTLGLFAAFVYTACGAIRLARFNVMATRAPGPAAFFTGLPIPGAALMLVTLVMFHQAEIATAVVAQAHVAVLVVVLSYLMVSNVRYRTFKNLRPTRRAMALVGLLLVLFISLGLLVDPSAGLLAVATTYITYGLLEEVLFFRRRRREELAAKAAAVAGPQLGRVVGAPPDSQPPTSVAP